MLSRILFVSVLGVSGILLTSTSVFAASTYSVFDIKKTLPLNSHQKVYRDYYVNMGADQGVKPGSIIAVYRRQGVIDYFRNTLHDDLLVPIAHMKVIQTGKDMSVARLESKVSAKQIPVVEFNSIMLGDRVELVVEQKKLPKKTKKINRSVAGKNA